MWSFFLVAQVAESDGLDALARSIFQAVSSGKLTVTSAVAVVVLMATVWLLRKVLAPKAPFFATKLGALTLNIAASGLGAAITALLSGVAFSWGLLGASLLMSYYAAGGHGIWKTVWETAEPHVWPFLQKILPTWLQNLTARGNLAVEVAKAEKQGLAAATNARSPKAEDLANGP